MDRVNVSRASHCNNAPRNNAAVKEGRTSRKEGFNKKSDKRNKENSHGKNRQTCKDTNRSWGTREDSLVNHQGGVLGHRGGKEQT